jgi:hypothetical protein
MSNVAQGTFSDPLDKLVTFVIVWALLLALPARIKANFGNAVAPARSGSAAKSRRPAGRKSRSGRARR